MCRQFACLVTGHPSVKYCGVVCCSPGVHVTRCVYEAFTTTSLQIQVAHFEPDTITLTGEGVFPRISFNLPREVTNENYSRLRKRVLENLLPAEDLLPAGDFLPAGGRDAANENSQDEVTVSEQHVHVLYDASPVACTLSLPSLNLQLFVPPHDLECEIERLMVVEVAQKHLDKMQGAGRKPSRPR